MKNVLLSSVAFLGLTVGTMAADLPSRVAPVPVAAVPVFTWTGFYVGVQAGYAWGNGDYVLSSTTGTAVLPFQDVSDTDGFVGGAHVGYNFQFGSFVAGLEADIEGAGIDGAGTYTFRDGATLAASSDLTVQGSLRARLGVAFDRVLVYATGGLAFASFDTDYVFVEPITDATTRASFDDTNWGWTLGAGVEYAFTNNFTARLEYRYTQFDDYRHSDDAFFDGGRVTTEAEFHTVRAGVSYKFGTY